MTTTTIETAIATLEVKIAEARTRVTDYSDQIATLDRERYMVKAHLDAYLATLAMLNGDEATTAPASTPRAKPGEIPAAILSHLGNYPDGVTIDGLVDR